MILKIEKIVFGGYGLARSAEGKIIFVEGGYPGETVEAELFQENKNQAFARVKQVLDVAAYRVRPQCTAFGKCGGCDWQAVDYRTQVEWKKQIVIDAFARQWRQPPQAIEFLLQVQPAEDFYHYRNRTQLHGTSQGIGYFKKNSNDIVYIDECPILSSPLQEKLKKYLEGKRFQTDAAKFGAPFKVEWEQGDGEISETYNAPNAVQGFSQVNRMQNEVLKKTVYQRIQSFQRGSGVLWDLYGGSGNLSRGLLSFFPKILCVDLHNQGEPYEQSKRNQSFACIQEPVRLFLRKSEESAAAAPDVILLDPPRAGVEKEVLLKLKKLNIRQWAYVSCNLSTLLRDLKNLEGSGKKAKISSIDLIDMFPQTFHIELLVCFTLN